MKNYNLVSNQRSSVSVPGFLSRVQITIYLRVQKLNLAPVTADQGLADKLCRYTFIYWVALTTVQFPVHKVDDCTGYELLLQLRLKQASRLEGRLMGVFSALT